MIPPIIDRATFDSLADPVVADVRWYLDGRRGDDAFVSGHLPGAIFVDVDRDLAAHDLPATDGRHPLPTPEAFAAAMSALGIGDSSTVVAYDDSGGMTAGRLVVMLRMLEQPAALLDGGLAAWDGPLEIGPGRPAAPATFTPRPWPLDRLAAADDVEGVASSGGAVLDSRSPDRFRGEPNAIDTRPGHIPGARNAPWATVLDDGQRVRSRDDLRAHFDGLGLTADGDGSVDRAHEHDVDDRSPIAYCGSGVSACLNLLAAEHAGLRPPRLYVGSWSGWSADPDRPVERDG